MKAQRLNLCTPVRLSLLALGYSTVKIVNAVNAELGKLAVVETTGKMGDGKLASKGTEYRSSVSETHKLSGKLTMPLYFDAWHSAVAKVEKIAPFKAIEVPAPFVAWADKFAKADKKEIDAEIALTVESEEPQVTLA